MIAPCIIPLRTLAELKPPTARTSVPIIRKNILVVTKRTKLEHDMHRLDKNMEEILALYDSGHEDKTRIVASHHRQCAVRQKVATLLSPEQIRSRDDFTKEDLRKASLVIALGGDNHFQYVAQHIDTEVPIMGINSDPQTSYGALLSGSVDDLEGLLTRIEQGNYSIEPWPRLRATVNDTVLPPALCDLFIGEEKRQFMSRHTLAIVAANGEKIHGTQGRGVEQKSSGMIVALPAGCSSWMNSASRYIFPEGLSYPKTSRVGIFALTEASNTHPGQHTAQLPQLCAGDVIDGEKLEITSLNDSKGIVVADSLEEAPFPRGSKVTIALDKNPLWVIRG